MGLCKLYPSLLRPGPYFWGEASHATPQHGWRSASSIAGDIESNPGPKPTLKLFYTHSLNYPHSLNTLIHQPTHRLTHPHLYNSPPKTSYTPPAPTRTPYTLDLIQPTRPDSPHLSPPHKHPYVTPQHHPFPLFTSPSPLHHPHTVTRNKNTSKTKQRY